MDKSLRKIQITTKKFKSHLLMDIKEDKKITSLSHVLDQTKAQASVSSKIQEDWMLQSQEQDTVWLF